MKNAMKPWLALLAALLLPLCALAEEIVYVDEAYIAFPEPYGYSLINVGPACSAQVGLHRYEFLRALQPDVRHDVIRKTEATLTALQTYGAVDKACTIHVVKGRYAPRVEGDTLYIGTAAYATVEHVIGAAELCFGKALPYGLLYGVSCEAAEALGLALDAPAPLHDALSAMTGDNRAYLDLNYACFIEPYADESMQAHVQSVARAFASWLTTAEKAALLTGYSDEAFYTRLNAFLAANGQSPYDNAELWGVVFHGGGDGSVRLRWETPSASYILDDAFEDFERAYSEDAAWNPLNGSYGELRAQILHFEEVLRFTRETLSPYQAAAPLTIWLENQSVGYSYGYNRLLAAAFYDPAPNTIHLGCVDSLGHEYVHAVMNPTNADLAMEECLAYYIDIFILADMQRGGFEALANAVEANDNAAFLALTDQVSTLLGHAVDFHNPADYLAVSEAELFQANGAAWQILSQHAFTSAATGIDTAARYSFFHYLLTRWGWDVSLQAIAEDAPSLLGASSWEALSLDWHAHLEAIYGSLKN